MKHFVYEMHQELKISCSGETGEVIGRAEHADAEDQYRLRYCCADGRAVEDWWSVSALESV